MRCIGRNDFPLPLGRRNRSLCERARLAGKHAESVRTNLLDVKQDVSQPMPYDPVGAKDCGSADKARPTKRMLQMRQVSGLHVHRDPCVHL